MLNPSELHKILDILDKQFLLFVSSTIGESGLSEGEKKTLEQYGVDYKSLYDQSKDLATLNFQLGQLSNILGESQLQSFTYKSLVKYIQDGNYIPLNATERAVIQSIKMQSLADIRSAKGRIFNDINNAANKGLSTARANQEEFIREQIKEGTAKRKGRKEIAREIARLTGDWKRDFNKSVQYISHTAFNEGRAAIIEKRYGGNDKAKVWFLVQKEACKYCKEAYLKDNEEPRVFTIKELQANGNNIGKKVADWLPCFNMHVACRCTCQEYIPGTIWNGSKFIFPPKKEESQEKRLERPKIRVFINGKESWV